MAYTFIAYHRNGYAVQEAKIVNDDGSTILTNTDGASGGGETRITSADGKSITFLMDDDGDQIICRVDTRVTSAVASESAVETLSHMTAPGRLTDRQITTTNADLKTFSINRDGNGDGFHASLKYSENDRNRSDIAVYRGFIVYHSIPVQYGMDWQDAIGILSFLLTLFLCGN